MPTKNRSEGVTSSPPPSRYDRSLPSTYLATPPPDDDPGPAHEGLSAFDRSETARPQLRNSHTVHASASEFFQTPLLDYDPDNDEVDRPHMPVLTRQTTYSSLPPSPRFEEYQSTDRRQFDEALERLQSDHHHRSKSNQEVNPVDDLGFGTSPRKTGRRSDADADADDAKVVDLGKADEQETDLPDGLSLWDLLRDEVGVEDWDGWIVDGKWERIANFLAVPLAVEKVSFPLISSLSPRLRNVESIGHPVWRTLVPRRVPVQLHHTPHPVYLCDISDRTQPHRSPVYLADPAYPPTLHPPHAPPLHPHRHPPLRDGRQQDVPHRAGSRHHQALCHLQCSRGESKIGFS